MDSDVQKLFIMFWFGNTLYMLGIIVAVVVWAKKSGQFKDQQHASRLPLEINDNSTQGTP
ncbi:MAG TPA: hypothetical protein VHO72_05520 [Bacteroidales bacterium]|nr:hypothetical protein [Bacteroidales bacterium]